MTDFKNSYEKLYGKSLTPQQVAEMKFNLLNYVKTLIQMDKQHQAWLKEQAAKKNNQKQSSED
jgi:hypothetical protein